MKLYRIWFPEFGGTKEEADTWGADTPSEAAEKAAADRCKRDVEWRDLVVSMLLPGGEEVAFDVTVVSRPEFYARERLHPAAPRGSTAGKAS